jgi:hypothetical protein
MQNSSQEYKDPGARFMSPDRYTQEYKDPGARFMSHDRTMPVRATRK